MASILIFVLVCNVFLINGQIYLPAPTNAVQDDPYGSLEVFKVAEQPQIEIQPSPEYFPNDQQNFQKFLTPFALPIKEAENFHPDTQGNPSKYLPNYKPKPRKKNFPKKYKTGLKKLKTRPKIDPIAEAVEDFSTDSFKNKRRIPISFSGPSQQLTNPFASEINSLKKSHEDYNGGFSGPSYSSPSGLGDGERMQYQMFGMDGPHSYKFGYDTGKGHNRHFRFEERDNEGKIKGHYGFVDQEGKMSMIHYEADPHTGYRAGPYRHPENNHDFDYNHQNGDDY